jgi:hypothetical protein
LDKIIEDKELGRLIVRDNVRAKRLVFRTKADAIYVSIPPGVTMKEVKEAIEKLRSRLLDSRQKLIRPLIDLNYRIETEYFKLSLVSGKRDLSFCEKSSFPIVHDLNLSEHFCKATHTAPKAYTDGEVK